MRRILGLGVMCLLTAACSGSLSETDAPGGLSGHGGAHAGGASGAGGTGGVTGTPVTCTSQNYWTQGDKGSEFMHPGGACLTCHAINRNAPTYLVAGTVYPTSHEPDDCNGSNGTKGITVVITDSGGKQLPPLPVNDVGNFSYAGTIAGPFHVKVVANGKENQMSAAPATGDCNSCHTRDGANSAPGRILAP
jgi:hypothetical protein